MSFAVFQQLTRGTVVDACLVCPFTSPEATNLILCKGDHLEVYDVQKRMNRLQYTFSAAVFGRPEALAAFRPSPMGPAHLAVVLRHGRYLAVLRYDPEFGNVRTCGQHVLVGEEDGPGGSGGAATVPLTIGFKPQVSVDPEQRCMAIRAAPDHLLVFPISAEAGWRLEAGPAVSQHGGLAFHQDQDHPPGLRAPFNFGIQSLRLHHLEDLQFLPGYRQPTVACLGQVQPGWGGRLSDANEGTSSLSIVVIDLDSRETHLTWAIHDLPHDLFRIIPLLPPLGGMLALAKNAVLYLKEHGLGFCQLLNPCATLGTEISKLKMELKDESALGVLLTGCAVAVLSPGTLLFSVQPMGRIYLAHLVATSREVVGDIVWTSPATVTPAWELCPIGDEFVFLAASAGGGILLRATPAEKWIKTATRSRKRPRVASHANGAGTGEEEDVLKSLLDMHEKLLKQSRTLRSYTFVVADELLSFGAIKSMAPWVNDVDKDKEEKEEDGEVEEEAALSGTQRFICCSGAGARGAMFIFQRAVPLESLTEFDLPVGAQFSAVWTFPHPADEPVVVAAAAAARRKRPRDGCSAAEGDAGEAAASEEDDEAAAAVEAAAAADAAQAAAEPRPQRLVMLSGSSRSMVLETTEEITEITEDTPFDRDAPTVWAGGVLGQTLAVQVTPQRMCFMRTRTPKSAAEVPPPFGFVGADGAPEARSGSISDPYVAVVFQDQGLRLFRVRHSAIAVGGAQVQEVTRRLPPVVAGPVVCASLYQHRLPEGGAACLLVVVTPSCRGTLRVVDLRTWREVFRAEHLADVPPVLRNAAEGQTYRGQVLDRVRALTDPCAPLPKSAGDDEELDAKARESASGEAVICAEFAEVDPHDRGPTLVVVALGRPVLLYRAFLPGGNANATCTSSKEATRGDADAKEDGDAKYPNAVKPITFPFHFALQEHDLLGLVESKPKGAYRPVTAFGHLGVSLAGVVVVPPHAGVPALWLSASRNRLYVHPLPGSQVRGFAPLHAPCCERGFFALSQGRDVGTVTAQVCVPATAPGLPDGQNIFDLHGAVPCVRRTIGKTPHLLATRATEGAVAVAVSESIAESSDQAAGPSPEEDPLADDWSIVRVPPVEGDPPPMARLQQRYELWIESTSRGLAKLSQYRFTFDPDEHVLCMQWVTLAGFPMPSLVVGTGVNTGEDLTCRGRLLIFSTKGKDLGVIPPVYQRSLKSPVTVVCQWGNYLIHSEGFKLFFERWENNNFNKLAFFDGSMCITSVSSIKNFLLLGDVRKGLDFVQWKEDTSSQNRTLRRLSRSPPSVPMTVLACEFVVCQKSLGIVALDHSGTAHLFQYSPHSDGREGDDLLRSCATFSMGSPCRAALRLQAEPGVQCLFAASGGGELVCLRPINDQVYRTVTTMLGILATRLPFRAGLSPRALRHRDGPPALVAPRKNIEDANMLRLFAFLSAPLQASVAEKMRLKVDALMRVALPCATSQLATLRPEPAAPVAPARTG